MKKVKRLLISALLAASLACAAVFGGCSESATDGRDGRDGKDLTINDIYTAYVEETNSDISLAEFIETYLSYNSEQLSNAMSFQSVVNRSLLSVVSVQAVFGNGTSLGSGVIVKVDKDSDGNVTDFYAVTNSHVIYNSSYKDTNDGFSQKISLFAYGKEYTSYAMTAKIVGVTKNFDLALLKVEGGNVKDTSVRAAEWCTDEEIYVGEDLFTVGNSDGEGLSVTKGISSVSSETISVDLENTLSRTDDYTYRVMRTDVAINEGNSGGGLFNSSGQIVGIVNAKQIATGIDEMNYALPSSTCRRIINTMLANESDEEQHGIDRALLGITTTSYNVDRVLIQKNVTSEDQIEVLQITEMVTVTAISSSSIASGKLNINDVLLNVRVIGSDNTIKDDIPINRMHNLTDALLSVTAGDTVVLTVRQGNDSGIYSENKEVSIRFEAANLTHYD